MLLRACEQFREHLNKRRCRTREMRRSSAFVRKTGNENKGNGTDKKIYRVYEHVPKWTTAFPGGKNNVYRWRRRPRAIRKRKRNGKKTKRYHSLSRSTDINRNLVGDPSPLSWPPADLPGSSDQTRIVPLTDNPVIF